MFHVFMKIYSNQTIWLLSVGIGVIGGTVIDFISKAYSNFESFDYAFAANLALLIMLDTITGVWVAYKKKDISSNGFAAVFNKLAVYMILLIAVHAATTSKTLHIGGLLSWVDSVLYTSIAVRELFSIMENLSKLGVITIPKAILERLGALNKSLNDTGESK